MKHSQLLMGILSLTLVACTPQTPNSALNETPEAFTDNTAVTTETNEIDEQMATIFLVDPSESNVQWRGAKAVGDQHYGTVDVKTGELLVDIDNQLATGEVILDMTSIEVLDLQPGQGKAQLEQHLNSDDFFNTSQHPEAILKIKQVQQLDDPAKGTHRIFADLTIKGITNEISFPANVNLIDQQITAEAAFVFDRSLWDVRFGSGSFFEDLGDNLIKDEVEMEITLIANQES